MAIILLDLLPPICITETSDSGYILSAPINKLIKLDSQGNIEWSTLVSGGKIIEANNSYVVAGFSINSLGTTFSNIARVDINGNILWTKSFDNGFNGNIAFRALSRTTDGNYAIAGNWGSNFWFGIMDINGNILVNKTYPSSGSSNVFTGITNAVDGGYILCGQNGNASAVLYKVDSQGNLEWNNTYSPDVFNSVVQTPDNGYVAIGAGHLPLQSIRTSTITSFIVKVNDNGNQEWIANYSAISGITATSDMGDLL